MRNLNLLNGYRRTGPEVLKLYGSVGDHTCGAFAIPSPVDKYPMNVIASNGFGWDHVSVSRKNRCPNWPEMDYVKQMFFGDDETVMQLHVPKAEHINFAPTCLHLWRPHDQAIPRPPGEYVMAKIKDVA